MKSVGASENLGRQKYGEAMKAKVSMQCRTQTTPKQTARVLVLVLVKVGTGTHANNGAELFRRCSSLLQMRPCHEETGVKSPKLLGPFHAGSTLSRLYPDYNLRHHARCRQ